MLIKETTSTPTNYKKIYMEKEDDNAIRSALRAMYSSNDVNKDALFFGRAVGVAVEDCVNDIVKQMDRAKVDSREQQKFVEVFFSALQDTLKSTKKLHKMRNGE